MMRLICKIKENDRRGISNHDTLLNYVYDNEVGMGQEISNHSLVFIKMLMKNLPCCGKGLYKLPNEIIKNKKIRDTSEKRLRSFDKWVQQYKTKECLCERRQEITELRSNGQNCYVP